jgi:hypothetical protein
MKALFEATAPGERPPLTSAARRVLRQVGIVAAYAVVTVAFTWPVSRFLTSVLTGPPTGDTGVYVWNVWVFGHELVERGGSPFYTSAILSLGPLVDLAQHNYTPVSGLLGLILVPVFGLVGAFNLIYLGLIVATAYAMYLLARDVAGEGIEAWLAGLVLAFSPALVARGTAHFSLVAAAPLPLFVLWLRVSHRTNRRRYMAAAGAAAAWAAYSDPYYGVYCLVLAIWHAVATTISIRVTEPGSAAVSWPRQALAGTIAASALLAVGIALTGGGRLSAGPLAVGLQTLYTPMLVLTVAVMARLAVTHRPRLALHTGEPVQRLVRLAPWGVASGALLLMPLLWPLVLRAVDGRFVSPKVFWRTSTPGVDAISFLLPNPSHPLLFPWLSPWLASREGGFVENVASIPYAVLGVVVMAGLAWKSRRWLYWAGLALLTGALALGPFVHVAGVNLHVPTPWALARYLPVIGQARAPARFTVLVMMAVAVLFALGLRALVPPGSPRRRIVVAGVAGLLVFELFPAPRPVYPAQVPSVYDTIAADTRDIRVLELPFGVRDGLSSFGDFNASAQYHQTHHGKRLIGGYLSRVSISRVESIQRFPVLNALMLLSQGSPVPLELAEAARDRAPYFLRDAQVGWVVVAHLRAPPALVDFAIRTFNLELVARTETRTLYRPRPGPAPLRAEVVRHEAGLSR